MSIPFVPSKKQSSVGIEWELMLVDRQTRDLAPYGLDVIHDLTPLGDAEHPVLRKEFMHHIVEMITPVCDTVEQATSSLSTTLAQVRQAAQQYGAELLGVGAHPFAQWRDQKIVANPRYDSMIERQGDAAARLTICGVHVHVGMKNRDAVLPVMNACMPYFGHLLALSSSSPYWQGRDMGYASARTGIFEALSTAGIPPIFSAWKEYEEQAEGSLASGTIMDMGQLWWDIRPHPNFGTIEVRIADCCSTVQELAAIAALCQCLIDRFARLIEEGYTLPVPLGWIIRENKWRASRYGLDAEFVADASGRVVPARAAIAELVEDLTPTAHRLGCADELAMATRIISAGASYERQRVVADASDQDLTAVVDYLVAQMRDGFTSEQRADDTDRRIRR